MTTSAYGNSHTNELEKSNIAKVSPPPHLKQQIWIYFPKRMTLIHSLSYTPTHRHNQTMLSHANTTPQCYWVQDISSFTKNNNTREVRLRAHSHHAWTRLDLQIQTSWQSIYSFSRRCRMRMKLRCNNSCLFLFKIRVTVNQKFHIPLAD
jgi:hypothetical protein